MTLKSRPRAASSAARMGRSPSSTGPATTTGRCPRASSIPARAGRSARCARCWEETGLRCELGEELSPTYYDDRKGRSKAVRYWLMTPDARTEFEFEPNEEVDELRWLPPSEADRTA